MMVNPQKKVSTDRKINTEKEESISLGQSKYQQARLALQQGQLQQAIFSYQQAIRCNPKHLRACQELGSIFLQLKHWSEAIAMHRQALQIKPNLPESYHELGDALSHLKQWSEATQSYQKAIQLRPDFSWSYNNLGDIFIELKQWEEAVTVYQKAIQLNPDFSWSHHNLGKAYLMLQQWEKAVTACQKAIELNSESCWSHYNLAEALFHLQKWDQAIPAYGQALQLQSDLPQAEERLNYARHQSVKEKLELAKQHYWKAIEQDPDNIELYHKALELDPLSPELYMAVGKAWQNQGEFNQAIIAYEQALMFNPNWAEAYGCLAEVLTVVGRETEALEARFKGLTLEPSWATSEEHLTLGNQLQERDKLEQAKICYQRVLKFNPNMMEAYSCLGQIYVQQQQWNSAIESYQQGIERFPENSKYYQGLGEVWAQQGKWKQAISFYQKAIKIKPNDGLAYHHYGDALLNLERWSEAIQYYQKALEFNPELTWSYWNLGITYSKLDNWEKVWECYQAIDRIDVSFLDAYLNADHNHNSISEEIKQGITAYRNGDQFQFKKSNVEQNGKDKLIDQNGHSVQPQLNFKTDDLMLTLEDMESFESQVALLEEVEEEPKKTIEAYQKQGALFREKYEWENAKHCYQKVVEIEPGNGLAYHHIGDACLNLEQYEQAIAAYKNCLETHSEYTWSYHNLGLALAKMERWEDAFLSYAKVDELEPEFWKINPVDFQAQHQLGEILFQKNEFEKAIHAYQRAIILNPASSASYHKMGDALLLLERWQEAEISFRHAIEINPEFNWSHYNLGEVLSKQGKINQAINAYKAAWTLDPNMPYIQEKLSQSLHQQLVASASAAIDYHQQLENNQTEEELSDPYTSSYQQLKKILKINSSVLLSLENANSCYQLGEAFVQQEEWSKAIPYLRKAFVLNPKTHDSGCLNILGQGSYSEALDSEMNSKNWVLSQEITIIIPIYNAYEDTQQCIEAVLKYTDSRYDILLIDDCSSDPRVTEFVKKTAREIPQVTCLKNPQNLGFVKTCNFAFEITDGEDVIILNSDTIVTPGWVEKLTVAAYSDDLVGSVTPLTNNGEICSVPNWLEYNDIPNGYTVENFGKMIEAISFWHYPTIPTCVGFCTYMKREVFDRIGFFDEVSFGKGYGEENDWSRRAIEAGYHHIIDDATFVYHAGGKSFGVEEKEQLVINNFAPLKHKHPDYFQEVHDFIAAKPVQETISNVQLHLKLTEIRQLSPVCFIIHNNPDIPVNFPLGGTEYHCQALIEEIRKTQPVYTLCYNQVDEALLFNLFLETEVLRFEFPCSLEESRTRNYQSSEFLKIFVQIIQYFNPRLIHIHHLINLPLLDIKTGLKQLKIPYLLTLHDYYFICPNHNLLDWQSQFCYEYKNDQYCSQCIQTCFREGEELKQNWHQWCQELMANALGIFAPSSVTRSYFAREYPELGDKVQVIRHGIMKEDELKKNLELKTSTTSQAVSFPLKIAFVGGIDQKKGLNLIIDLLQAVDVNPALHNCFEFELHGATSQPIPESVKNLRVCDPYEQKNLPHLLKSVDIVMFPGIWPETYCLVADEVLSLGIPVIATPLGAIAERIKKYKVGWISQSSSADDLLEVLTTIVQNPEEIEQIRTNVQHYPIISFESMSDQYLDKYNRFPPFQQETIDDSETPIKPQSLFFAQLKAQWFFSNR